MATEHTRGPDPATLDSDVAATGSEVIGPDLPKFDSDHVGTGAVVKDYASRADVSKGGKSLQVESGTKSPDKVRQRPSGAARKKE